MTKYELPSWIGVTSLTEKEKLKLNSIEAIPIVRIYNAKIVFDIGKIDDKFVKILSYTRIGNNLQKLSLPFAITDRQIYETFIRMNKFYSIERDWYKYVDDIMDFGIPVLNENKTGVNPEYIYGMYETINRHSNIISAFSGRSGIGTKNSISHIWQYGLHNIFGFSFIINLIGYARDYMYEQYGYDGVPISACEGRKGTKDCLYKIIAKEYPDFYFTQHYGLNGKLQTGEQDYKHYSHDDIVKTYIFNESELKLSESERINILENELASKYDLWYSRQFFETRMVAKDRIRRSIFKNENKRTKIK